MNDATPASRPRRIARLSVRGSMLLVLALALWLGRIVHLQRVQRLAVAAVERGGGSVRYDWELKRRTTAWTLQDEGLAMPAGSPRPPAPRWLVDAIGPDYFGTVVNVGLGTRDPDAVMAHVGRLEGVEEFLTADTPLTDAGMAHLSKLTHLKGLFLTGRSLKITSEGLKSIEGLHRLEQLCMRGFPGAGSDLDSLRGLTHLRYLNLGGPDVSDASLAQIKGLTGLMKLEISESRITTRGLESLAGLTGLESLEISRSQIDDLRPISRLPKLMDLQIGGPVDDAGVRSLANLQRLQSVFLINTRVTDAGEAQIKAGRQAMWVIRIQ